MFQYRVDQHLIALNLYRISINKTLVLEFMTQKISQNLNSMQKSVNIVKSEKLVGMCFRMFG